MEKKIELNASSKEVALKRALNILEVTPNEEVKVTEILKAKSFFGFFKKDGKYLIEVTEKVNETKELKETKEAKKEKKIEEPKVQENKTVKKAKEVVVNKVNKHAKKEEEVLTLADSLLKNMGLDLKIEILRIDSKACTINLFGEDNGIIIGKKGKTLNSYEYLLNTLIKDIKIDVDVEGFKEKRNETLRELARKMSEKALKTPKPIKLNPMPPRERKVIHEVVNQYHELDTYSEGKDPKRYIVIKRKK